MKRPKRGAFDYLLRDPIAYPGNEDALFPETPPKPSTNEAMYRLSMSMMPASPHAQHFETPIGPEPTEPLPDKPERHRLIPWFLRVFLCLWMVFLLGFLIGTQNARQEHRPTAFPATWFRL